MLQPYSPLAEGHIEQINVGNKSPLIWKIITTDPACYNAAEAYLKAKGYRFGWYDNGAGKQVAGWKFILFAF